MNGAYGNWKVLSQEKIKVNNRIYMQCKCSCGTVRNVIIKNLKSGISKSCGCVGNKKTTERNTKHNKRFSKVWTVWQGIKHRCYNKNCKQYKNYGGRGIKIHNTWKDDFIAFYNYIGDAPKDKSLDRINNNGNYEPGNIRWATPKEQCQNKSNNVKINGVCVTDISFNLGGAGSLVHKRLKRGWSIQRAITEKSRANI